MNEERWGAGLAAVLEMWHRRRWLAMLVFAVPFSAIVSLVTFLPNTYRSGATILVERQQVPEEFVKSTVPSGLDVRLQTITQEILSRPRLEQLIHHFGLYADLRERLSIEQVVERMRRDIEVDTNVAGPRMWGTATVAFTVSYQGNDPLTVARVSNTLASYYVEEYTKTRERQASGTAEFLRRQLQEMEQRLNEQERRVSEFKKRNLGELPQQLDANLTMLQRLNVQLQLNSDNQSRAMLRREALARQLSDVSHFEAGGGLPGPPAAGVSVGAEPTALRLARLKQELTELRTRFSDKYPDVIRLKEEIAVLERQLGQTKSTVKPKEKEVLPGPSPHVLQVQQALNDVQTELKLLKDEEKRLRASIASYQARVENTPRREQEFQELSRDYETTRELYRTLLRRYEEAQLAESLEQRQKGEQFRILEPAVPPKAPSAPERLKLFFVGLVLSLGLAAGAVFLADQLDTSFHTADELRALGNVPVLVTIPKIVTTADASRQRWRFGFCAAAAILGLVLIVGSAYLVAKGYVPPAGLIARAWLLRT